MWSRGKVCINISKGKKKLRNRSRIRRKRSWDEGDRWKEAQLEVYKVERKVKVK